VDDVLTAWIGGEPADAIAHRLGVEPSAVVAALEEQLAALDRRILTGAE
jgi:hypothetical protein